MIELDEEQKKIFDFVTKQNKNVFIQGQAGTGKSTLIEHIRANSEKNIVVASPTAIAATNVRGCTLHSLFRLPPKDYFDLTKIMVDRKKSNDIVLRNIDMLIIDEISMVRPDMLDAIDKILKKLRRNKLPFGDVQIVLVGDLYQLPPIIKGELKPLFKDVYGSELPYFFDSKAYKEGDFKNFELTIVHRQDDLELLDNLKNIRNGENLEATIDFFNTIPKPSSIDSKDAVVITPYKASAEAINERKLDSLAGKKQEYEATMTGSFKKMKETPAPATLSLKVGAFVIFTKNSKDKQWINGTTGIVTQLFPNLITVKLTNSGQEVLVERDVWEIIHYDYDEATKKLTKEKIGEFKQFPLQLGWAITIHKSQSKTLDKVVIDVDRGIFAPGQLYVALSRTRKKTDMFLKCELQEEDVILDRRITKFLTEKAI